MSISLMKLPFALDAFEPFMSQKTLEFHYGKHHKNYVTTLNKLISGTPYDKMELVEIMQLSYENQNEEKIFNNAAQVWNHNFFWQCLNPNTKGVPDEERLESIIDQFDSLDNFEDKFKKAGKGLFGSGWVWLVKKPDQTLVIECLKDAGNPVTYGDEPILTCDVWEHAYYLDYQNERPEFLNQFWKIINWDFVAENLERSNIYSHRPRTHRTVSSEEAILT